MLGIWLAGLFDMAMSRNRECRENGCAKDIFIVVIWCKTCGDQRLIQYAVIDRMKIICNDRAGILKKQKASQGPGGETPRGAILARYLTWYADPYVAPALAADVSTVGLCQLLIVSGTYSSSSPLVVPGYLLARNN
jgi:hypothetical protein